MVLAVNKCENVGKADLMAAEFWDTGLEPIPVSAISGSGEARRHPLLGGQHRFRPSLLPP